MANPDLERVARAMYEAEFPEESWDKDATIIDHAEYKEMAKSMIRALMEPSEGMLEAGMSGVDWPDMPAGGDCEEIVRQALRSALQSILKEGE